jgi:hypothetical protein
MEKKQTAVEWLFEKLWNEPKDKLTWYAILKQAKEMEKEDIVDSYIMGSYDLAAKEFRPEQYYNEIYGKETRP